ncbi:MAG: TIGR04002 family protein [Oscillospiraceae bacterium]|nr:TIGR04002 family protein [Oscillospiraceae bacterium]
MNKSIKLISMSALLAAMIIVLTTFIKIPIGNGYIHMGDSIIYLASCLLPLPYAAIVAAISGAMSDALGGFAVFILPTVLIKALITIPFSSKNEKILTKRNAIMVIPAGVITVAGYFAACLFIYDWTGAIIGLLGDTIQAIVSAVAFLLVSAALDKVKLKQTLLPNG